MNIQELIDICKSKLDKMIDNTDFTGPILCSFYSRDGKYVAKGVQNGHLQWFQSFYLANLAYMYLYTKDEKYLGYLDSMYDTYLSFIKESRYGEVNHDTGFIFSLYSVAMYKITGQEKYLDMSLWASDEYIKRFSFATHAFNGFTAGDDLRPTIILSDMMNVCLLDWAYRKTKQNFLLSVIKMHTEKTLKSLLKDNYFFLSGAIFDDTTGEKLGNFNAHGVAPDSIWMRGQIWAAFSLLNRYEVTEDPLYLQTAIRTMEQFIAVVPEEEIPVWDLHADDDVKDVSSLIFLCCAADKLQRLKLSNKYAESIENIKKYTDKAFETIVDKCFTDDNNTECFLEGNSFIGTKCGCLLADYLFMELLMRKYMGENFLEFWI